MNTGKNLRLGVNIDHVATVRNAEDPPTPTQLEQLLFLKKLEQME